MIISYLTLRRWIGILAMAFPICIILFGGFPMQTSISAYYWTTAGDLFVALLVTMGIFLLTYNGYDKLDRALTMIAGIAMIGVALFPCLDNNGAKGSYVFAFLSLRVNGIIHYVFAGITFAMLGVMSMFQFTRDGGYYQTIWKKRRNRVYKICGYIIFGVLAVAIPLQLIPRGREVTDVIRLWFWLEAIMVWAFGVSWIVKGETLWRDK